MKIDKTLSKLTEYKQGTDIYEYPEREFIRLEQIEAKKKRGIISSPCVIRKLTPEERKKYGLEADENE